MDISEVSYAILGRGLDESDFYPSHAQVDAFLKSDDGRKSLTVGDWSHYWNRMVLVFDIDRKMLVFMNKGYKGSVVHVETNGYNHSKNTDNYYSDCKEKYGQRDYSGDHRSIAVAEIRGAYYYDGSSYRPLDDKAYSISMRRDLILCAASCHEPLLTHGFSSAPCPHESIPLSVSYCIGDGINSSVPYTIKVSMALKRDVTGRTRLDLMFPLSYGSSILKPIVNYVPRR